MHLTLESVDTLPVREVPLGGKTNGIDKESRVCRPSIFSLDVPLVCLFVVLCSDDTGIEGDVLLYIEDIFYVCKVCLKLRPARVLF